MWTTTTSHYNPLFCHSERRYVILRCAQDLRPWRAILPGDGAPERCEGCPLKAVVSSHPVGIVLCPVTLLIFLATATGAGVVAPDFSWHLARCLSIAVGTISAISGRQAAWRSFAAIAFGLAAGFGDVVGVGAQVAQLFALNGLRALDVDGDAVFRELEQLINDVVLDGELQVLEHRERFVLEFDQRVALGKGTEVNAVAQGINSIDMVHPEAIDDLQGDGALDVANSRNAKFWIFGGELVKFLSLFLIGLNSQFGQLSAEFIAAQGMQILGYDVIGDGEPGFERFEKVVDLLFLSDDVAGNVRVQQAFDFVANHVQDALMHVGAFKYGATVGVDDFALFGDHVVVFDHVLTQIEVVTFDAGLGLFDETRDHAIFERHVLVHTHHLHDFSDALGCEAAHQFVLKRDVEARGARVALASGATAQLVVDAAGLVAFGADDAQAAEFENLFAILFTLANLLLEQRLFLLFGHVGDVLLNGLLFFLAVGLVLDGHLANEIDLFGMLAQNGIEVALRVAAE